MNNPTVSNPNDFKVVVFQNTTDFTFTPEMGCMYDGRPIFGITGAPGINAGESLTVPYHIGQVIARNLAKRVLNTSSAATVDLAGIPTGVAVWSAEKLEEMKNSYLKEMYSEEKPVAMSETDKLMAKVEEYKKMVEGLIQTKGVQETAIPIVENAPTTSPTTFQDKAEVIAELTKRGIKFDARQNKATLEKLLA